MKAIIIIIYINCDLISLIWKAIPDDDGLMQDDAFRREDFLVYKQSENDLGVIYKAFEPSILGCFGM